MSDWQIGLLGLGGMISLELVIFAIAVLILRKVGF